MKTALVTGGNRGIGLEVCHQLASKGFNVILTARDQAKGNAAAESLKQHQLPVHFFQLDVANEESIHSLALFIEKEIGVLDVLVNNAGIMSSARPVSDEDMTEIRSSMETNFFGPMMLTRALLPLLVKSPDARIINVSSGMGEWQSLNGYYAGYRLSKVALNALTVMLAGELKKTSVKVNSMCPGWVKTDMGGKGAQLSVEQGAETITWLATDPHIPTGKFFRDKKEISF